MESLFRVPKWFTYWYLRFTLVTELYMVEAWEALFMNILLVVIASVLWYFNKNVFLATIAQLRGNSSLTEGNS